jgi:Tripartite tricarboxylate transporter family receptor
MKRPLCKVVIQGRQCFVFGAGNLAQPGALAVTMMTRSGALGYEASVWAALGAPRNTPAEIIDKLNSEINWALTHPKIKARLSNIGAAAIRRSVKLAGLMPGTGESWPLHDFRANA